MDARKIGTKSGNPFAALIGVSSLLAAFLYVAGFSFRWAYYYNFGVQHLVYNLSFRSFLIAAFELFRAPYQFSLFLLTVAAPLVVLNILLAGIAAIIKGRTAVARAVGAICRALGLTSPLLIDVLRAAVIVLATFRLGSQLGYEAFQADVSNSVHHRLPAVTAVLEVGKDSAAFVLTCGSNQNMLPPYIGDARRLQELQQFRRTCNSGGVTWRLLYRDDHSIYLFASETRQKNAPITRPLTLVLPNPQATYLIME